MCVCASWTTQLGHHYSSPSTSLHAHLEPIAVQNQHGIGLRHRLALARHHHVIAAAGQGGAVGSEGGVHLAHTDVSCEKRGGREGGVWRYPVLDCT